jgi:hypothetical protein
VLPENRDSTQKHFVHVTPRPILPRLKRSNDRVPSGVKMFRGVAIRRRVAATDVSARQAKAEVDPGRTHLQTILTPVRARSDVRIDLIEVQTSFVHDSTFVDFPLISTFVPASPSGALETSHRAHGLVSYLPRWHGNGCN